MSYIGLWLHWLAGRAQKSDKYRFTKFGRRTQRAPKKTAKIILQFFFLTWTRVLIKNQTAVNPQRTLGKMSYIWFWVHWLADHARKTDRYRFSKFARLTGIDPKEGAKIILKFLFVTRRWVFIKKERAIRKEEKRRKSLIFDFGCIGCQSMPQHLVNINLPNMVCQLQETLVQEQNLFWSYTF